MDNKKVDEKPIKTEVSDPVSIMDKLIGNFGWYVAWICLIPSLVKLSSGSNATVSVFILPKVPYRCKTCFDNLENLNYTKFEEGIEEHFYPLQDTKCGYSIDKCQVSEYVVANISSTTTDVDIPQDIADCCYPEDNIFSEQKCSAINEYNNYVNCEEFIFDHSRFETTATEDFNFVCGNTWLLDLSAALFYLGFGVGGVTAGIISDKMGRKYVMIFCSVCLIISDIVTSYASNTAFFMIMRFLNGFFVNGMMIPSYTLCMEFIGTKYRSWMTVWYSGVFALGIMSLSYPYAVLFNTWRHMQFWLFMPVLIPLIGGFFVPESYKWLMSKGRADEAYEVAYSCMKRNNSSGPCSILEDDDISSDKKRELKQAIDDKIEDLKNTRSNAGVLDLFTNKNIRPITLNLALNWFTNSILYYGLGLNAGNLPGSDIFNNFMNGIFEFPAYVIFPFLIDWKILGRNGTSGLFLILGGLFCLASTLCLEFQSCEEGDFLETAGQVLAFIGKFCCSGTFALAYQYAAEIYPSEVRSNGVAVCSAAARIGGILTPFILGLADYYSWIPGAIFTVLGVVAGICAFWLPDTNGMPLLATMEETDLVYFSGLKEQYRQKNDKKGKNDKENPSFSMSNEQ